MNRYKKITILIIILAISLCCFLSIEITIDRDYRQIYTIEDLKYLPSGEFLGGAALTYDELLADFLWIKAIFYFADHIKTDKDYTWLYHILNITTALDPAFQYPYEFGGIVLSTEALDIKHSIEILEKGMKNVSEKHPRYWYFPFYIAFNYMYHEEDFLKAAHYLELAIKFPRAPKYLPRLVAKLYANINDHDVAIKFLQEIIDNADNEDLKKSLKLRLNEVIIDKDIKLLEKALNIFYSKFNKYPDSIEELVKTGIIKELPIDPVGGKYYISQNNEIHSTSIDKKLKIRLDHKILPTNKFKIIPDFNQ
ncbi:MAG: hypothetical protein HQK76_05210 [Desulfobacterales bacterium]|nr:hypothetical protein [Desulfobacterales bacterium]